MKRTKNQKMFTFYTILAFVCAIGFAYSVMQGKLYLEKVASERAQRAQSERNSIAKAAEEERKSIATKASKERSTIKTAVSEGTEVFVQKIDSVEIESKNRDLDAKKDRNSIKEKLYKGAKDISEKVNSQNEKLEKISRDTEVIRAGVEAEKFFREYDLSIPNSKFQNGYRITRQLYDSGKGYSKVVQGSDKEVLENMTDVLVVTEIGTVQVQRNGKVNLPGFANSRTKIMDLTVSGGSVKVNQNYIDEIQNAQGLQYNDECDLFLLLDVDSQGITFAVSRGPCPPKRD